MLRRGSAFMAVVATALSVAGAASADVIKQGGFKYVEEEGVIGPGTTKTFAAECPGRTHVLGGGAAGGGVFGDTLISSSYPYDGADGDSRPDDGWKVKVSGFDDLVELEMHAVCARLTPTYKEKRLLEVPAMTSATDETVPCGQGRATCTEGSAGRPAFGLARATRSMAVAIPATSGGFGSRMSRARIA